MTAKLRFARASVVQQFLPSQSLGDRVAQICDQSSTRMMDDIRLRLGLMHGDDGFTSGPILADYRTWWQRLRLYRRQRLGLGNLFSFRSPRTAMHAYTVCHCTFRRWRCDASEGSRSIRPSIIPGCKAASRCSWSNIHVRATRVC